MFLDTRLQKREFILSSPTTSPSLILAISNVPTPPVPWKERIVKDILYSRRLANKIVFATAIFQSAIFSIAAFVSCRWHLQILAQIAQETNSIFYFFLNMIPGLAIVPCFTALLVWPVFVVIGSFRSHWTQDLDTVKEHIELLREFQARIYTTYLDSIFEKEAQAFGGAIGTGLPNDIKIMIIEKLRIEHEQKKIRFLAPLLWKCNLKYQHEPSFKRALHLWGLFTGIHESYGIPTSWHFSIEGKWILCFSRDGYLLVWSCLFRYCLVIWMTR
jgi:hypothetical protein